MIDGEFIVALVGAACVGISLGLLGSGGSILTVPLLVYLVGHAEKAAIAESLAIVGIISLYGALRCAVQGKLHGRALLAFGPASMAGAWGGAYLAQWIPGSFQLLGLGAIMLAAAVLMLRPARVADPNAKPRPRHPFALPAAGYGVGAATGIVGIGGGFMIVPALVFAGGLPATSAVATSLAIITLNCLIGFATYWHTLGGAQSGSISALTIALFGVVGVAGATIGQRIGGRLSPRTFRRIFAIFIVVVGVWIIVREGIAAARAA